jgi:hypothetical protein
MLLNIDSLDLVAFALGVLTSRGHASYQHGIAARGAQGATPEPRLNLNTLTALLHNLMDTIDCP